MKVHDFYKRNNLRVLEIAVGSKSPFHVGWPTMNKPAAEVEKCFGARFNKYGWLLDDDHLVVDIDVHNPEENGYESLRKFENDLGVCLDDVCKAVVKTPSGGKHYYFRKDKADDFGKTFKQFYPGIDFIHGVGKQVVAANSHHDKYPGTYELDENAELVDAPREMIDFLVGMKPKIEDFSSSTATVGERSGDDFNQSERGLDLLIGMMKSLGYTFRRAEDCYEFDRPNKSSDSPRSGYVGRKSSYGNYLLTFFSLASEHGFPSGESITIFRAFSILCHRGNDVEASKQLYNLGFASNADSSVDLSYLLSSPEESTPICDYSDDEDFCESMVPSCGLLKDVFDFYMQITRRPSNIIGLAVSVALCESVFGRRVRSYTDMRTHDYTIIVAPTSCGKEACIKTVQKIIFGACPSTKFLIPSNVQSGNGLLHAVFESPACMWMCDEFGTFLEGALDKKLASKHTKDIVDHLLQMYTRAEGRYQGAAHAAGARNEVEQPSLSLLGITTGSTMFEHIDKKQVESGLFGRCTFWPVQTRPKLRASVIADPSEDLLGVVRGWLEYMPGGINAAAYPEPPILKFSEEARHRWESHEEAIDAKMMTEGELRAAVWGRVAGRSMKLALVHRCSRLETNPADTNWDFVYVEAADVEWGIKISNWLARTACDYASKRVGDFSSVAAVSALQQILKAANGEWVSRSLILRRARELTAGDIGAAAKSLSANVQSRDLKKAKGRPETQYKWVDA